MGNLIGVIIIFAIAILLFLAFRQVVLWYWKVDSILKNQEVTNQLLVSNNLLLNEQIAIMKSQNRPESPLDSAELPV